LFYQHIVKFNPTSPLSQATYGFAIVSLLSFADVSDPFCAGYSDSLCDMFIEYAAVVSSGQNNTAASTFSTVSGGFGNVAAQTASNVIGGAANEANGRFSSVGGGQSNKVRAVLEKWFEYVIAFE
jgi:hypothetical protein